MRRARGTVLRRTTPRPLLLSAGRVPASLAMAAGVCSRPPRTPIALHTARSVPGTADPAARCAAARACVAGSAAAASALAGACRCGAAARHAPLRRPVAPASMGQDVQGARRPWGKTSVGQDVHGGRRLTAGRPICGRARPLAGCSHARSPPPAWECATADREISSFAPGPPQTIKSRRRQSFR